jgi:hypothetical protein
LSDLIKITGLWENDSKNGTYLSGMLGSAKVVIFRNKYKKDGSKQPDWELYISPAPKKELEKPAVPTQGVPLPAPVLTVSTKESEQEYLFTNDDIPF